MVGLAVAMPLGPTGCLCIDYGLRRGFWQSVAAGMGAAAADVAFGLVALLGVAAVAPWLAKLQLVLSLAGGLFIIYLGYKKLVSPPPQTPDCDLSSRGGDRGRSDGAYRDEAGSDDRPLSMASGPEVTIRGQTLQVAEGPGRRAAFATTFLFTLANPMTILGMTVLMASVGLDVGTSGWTVAALVLAGVGLGGFSWYLVLSTLSTVLRRTLSFKIVTVLQKFSGGLILVMGLFMLAHGLYNWLA
ncbi:MAG: LysE family translocator [Parachlamydiales bacterium]